MRRDEAVKNGTAVKGDWMHEIAPIVYCRLL